MNELLKSIFDSLGLESFFNNKGSYEGECVVYNYISNNSFYSDNVAHGKEYVVLLNVYSGPDKDIEGINEEIVKAMNNNGLKGGRIEKPILDRTGLYNTPIMFNGFLKKS